ncbi:hypothetical protein EWM64_g10420, partial [Hericium alpestre]
DNGCGAQLKKLIHHIVDELESIGLTPELLQKLLQEQKASLKHASEKGKEKAPDASFDSSDPALPKVVYELSTNPDRIEPRLHFWIKQRAAAREATSLLSVDLDETDERKLGEGILAWVASSDADEDEIEPDGDEPTYGSSLLYKLQQDATVQANETPEIDERASSPPLSWIDEASSSDLRRTISRDDESKEVIIPLVNDTAFYQLLSNALQSISKHLEVVHTDFISTLETLSHTISDTARPQSATSKFHPHSRIADPSAVTSPIVSWRSRRQSSDLYAWREIFQLYVEAEVFSSLSERAHGDRDVEDSEARLKLFAERVTGRGLGDRRTLKLAESRQALESFLQLNVFLLDLKKFQKANAEATRKILKKHAKRTALPLPTLCVASATALSSYRSQTPASDLMTLVVPHIVAHLPRMLVQAIGVTLLPIIPHVDDYACLICTSIAFKPIRLFCGHLFCVRCLVKMQKRDKGSCPMCRAPTVLQADRSNVDWALLNFMQDWFPEESREKLKQNEDEAAEEELRELGLDTAGCIIA